MTDIVDPFAGGITDPFKAGMAGPAPPPEKAGLISEALKGVGSGLAGIGRAAGVAATGAAGMVSADAGEWANRNLVEPFEAAQKAFAPAPEDQQTLATHVAHGVGSFLPTLGLAAVTGAAVPLAEGAAVGARMLHGAAVAAASMGLPAAINQAADAAKAGDDLSTAYTAGGVAGVMNTALGILPLSMKGGALTRAVTGAASGLATGEVQRDVMNEVFSAHPDQQTPFSGPGAVTNAVIGGMLGTILGPRADKVALTDAKKAAEADVAAGTPVETPPPAGPQSLTPSAAPIAPPLGMRQWMEQMGIKVTQATVEGNQDAYAQYKQDYIDRANGIDPVARRNDEAIKKAMTPSEPNPDAFEQVPSQFVDQITAQHQADQAQHRADQVNSLKDSLGDMSAVKTGFSKVGEFADLAESERADLEQRRNAAAEAAMKAKEDQAKLVQNYTREATADVDARVSGTEVQKVAADRARIVSDVLNDDAVPLAQKTARAQAELANAGHPATLTATEKAVVQKHADVSHAFTEEWSKPLPSLPNEMDVYGDAADAAARAAKAETLLAKAKETTGATLQKGMESKIKDALSKETPEERVAEIDKLRDAQKNPNSNTSNVLTELREAINPKKEAAVAPEVKPAAEAGGEKPLTKKQQAALQAELEVEQQGEVNGTQTPEAEQGKPQEAAKAAEPAVVKKGRPEGTTDERHSMGPPTSADDLYPYHMTRDQAAASPGHMFAEKAWWQDLAWAVEHKDTKIGKEVLENGKFTDEQMAQATQKAEQYAKQDEARRAFGENLERQRADEARTGLESDIRAVEKATKAARTVKAIDELGENWWESQGHAFSPDAGFATDDVTEAGLGHLQKGTDFADHPDPDAPYVRVVHNPDGTATIEVPKTLTDTRTPWDMQHDYRHETGHIADMRGGYSQADVLEGKRDGGAFIPKGDVATELVRLARTNPLFKKYFDYPLGADHNGMSAERTQEELFAQVFSLYTEPNYRKLLEQHAPKTAEFMKEVVAHEQERYSQNPKEFEKAQTQGADAAVGTRGNGPVSGADTIQHSQSAALTAESLAGAQKDFASDKPEKVTGAIDAALNGTLRLAQQAAAKVTDFASLELGMFKNMLGWQTLGYMKQRVESTPGLAKIVEPFRALTDAYDLHRRLGQELEDRATPYARSLELALHAIKDSSARREMSYNMMLLSGESSRLGINLRDNYTTNLARDASLKDANAVYVNDLHRQFMQMDKVNPQFSKAIEQGAQINKEMYVDRMATRVADVIRAGQQGELRQHIDALNFRNAPGKMDVPLQKVFADAALLPKGSGLKDQLAELQRVYTAQTASPYFHLGREGEFFVRARFDGLTQGDYERIQSSIKGYGKVLGDLQAMQDRGVFFRVDKPEQANALRRLIEDAAPGKFAKTENGYLDLAHGKLEAATLNTAAGLNNAMRSIHDSLLAHADTLGLDQNQTLSMKQAITRDFLSMLPETSSRKALMQRQGVPGYEGDFLKNFSSRMSGMVQDHATAYTANHFSDAFGAMRNAISGEGGLNATGEGDMRYRAQYLHDELAQRYGQGMQPVKADVVNIINSLGHTFYLALSPAFLLRTGMQPFHRGLPIIGSKFGFVAGGKEIAGSTKAIMQIMVNSVREGFSEGGLRGVLDANLNLDGSNLNAKDTAFMKWMHDMGEWNIGQSHQLARMAMGKDVRSADFTRFASMTAQYAEMTNRMIIGLAAFRLASAHPERIGNGDAMQYAKDVTRNTMDTFEPDQTSRQIGKHGFAGPVTPLMTSFMNYNLQTMQQVARTVHDGMFNKDMSPEGRQRSAEAKREFGGLMGTTMLLSGAMGLPFVTVFAGLYNWAMKDENHPHDVRADIQNFLTDVVGATPAAMLSHGLSRGAGFDLSTTGLNNLLPGSEFLADRRLMKDRLESQAVSVLGPALNAGIDIAGAASKMSDGLYMKGIETALPSGLKPIYKTGEMAARGYTDAKGNPIGVEATPWDMAVQMTGFSPADKAMRSEAEMYRNTDESLLQHRKTVISDQVFKAGTQGTPEDMSAAVQKLTDFNMQNPIDAIRDIGSVFRQHALELATSKASGTGIGVQSGRKIGKLENYRFSNAGGMP